MLLDITNLLLGGKLVLGDNRNNIINYLLQYNDADYFNYEYYSDADMVLLISDIIIEDYIHKEDTIKVVRDKFYFNLEVKE